MGRFSRRKLESNWSRYEQSEKQEPDVDVPTRRGADYHVLLESAGELRPRVLLKTLRFWTILNRYLNVLLHGVGFYFCMGIVGEESDKPQKYVCTYMLLFPTMVRF